MTNAAKPNKCSRCRTTFVQIVPRLELCNCSARGEMAHMIGAEADARALAERYGGLDVIRRKLENEKALKKDADLEGRAAGRSALAKRRQPREMA